MDSWTMTTSGISWTLVTIDDARISKTLIEPIITVERKGDQWGNVIVHKTAEELEQIIRDNSGPRGGLARLALEILRLRRDYAILLERWKEATQAPSTQNKPPKTTNR